MDQPKIYGGAWRERYGVTAHEATCDQPGVFGCDCEVVWVGQFGQLLEAVEATVRKVQALGISEEAA